MDPWQGSGDFGVSQENVLQGAFSGFITTGVNAVGEVCSTLQSPFVSPPTDRARVKVAFKVRYKTDEAVGPFSFFEDPFHAEFVTVQGAVDLLTIKTDGIFWTGKDPTNTKVFGLRSPPKIPPFKPGNLFASETKTLSVQSEIKLKDCEPVSIKFQICDWFDTVVDSAAFLDAVRISFKDDDHKGSGGKQCPAPIINPILESPPPREP